MSDSIHIYYTIALKIPINKLFSLTWNPNREFEDEKYDHYEASAQNSNKNWKCLGLLGTLLRTTSMVSEIRLQWLELWIGTEVMNIRMTDNVRLIKSKVW